jgi:hypothetical protein
MNKPLGCNDKSDGRRLTCWPAAAPSSLLQKNGLGNTVRGLASLFFSALIAMLTMAILASVLGRKLHLDNLRMRAAINNMSQGLCMFDGNERLVVCT